MPVFISHSHEDKEFVDNFAAHLVKVKTHVWVDSWELNVGDSLLTKIQAAIQEASALIVVLSKASVASEWCKKEIDAGLVRELNEKRAIVLPVLLEDCDIPLFLRDKKHADFRTNYDEGLEQVLEAIAKVTSTTLGKIEEPEWVVDWGIDWSEVDDLLHLRLTLVEQAENEPYIVLSEVLIQANEASTARYRQYDKIGLDYVGHQVLLEQLRDIEEFRDLQVVITDNLPVITDLEVRDSRTKTGSKVNISCRRLGEDNGKSVLLHIGKQVSNVIEGIAHTLRPPTSEEKKKIKEILSQR